ncbi:hypothetical protein EIP91_009839 [Steccherinum ochraceum]|uniref:Uncharacterized protein n=1 Tax=Steccherinum ochraceum TaxID=92696 RepID=A0A4R0R170_9APHY|nr:hypothetical protein EIP91_009839 [Steccherinum ochraceum]
MARSISSIPVAAGPATGFRRIFAVCREFSQNLDLPIGVEEDDGRVANAALVKGIAMDFMAYVTQSVPDVDAEPELPVHMSAAQKKKLKQQQNKERKEKEERERIRRRERQQILEEAFEEAQEENAEQVTRGAASVHEDHGHEASTMLEQASRSPHAIPADAQPALVSDESHPTPQLFSACSPLSSTAAPSPPLSPSFREVRDELLCQVFLSVATGGSFAETTPHLQFLKIANIFAETRSVDFDGYDEDSDLEIDTDEMTDTSGDLTDVSVSDIDDDDLLVMDDDDLTVAEDAITSPPPESLFPSQSSRSQLRDVDHPRVLKGAFKTWQSLSLYLYRDYVAFSPLRSYLATNSQVTVPELSAQFPQHSPCSPKSMYRLAAILQLPELKDQALASLKSYLNETNIIDELFSDFTWRYPESLQMEAEVYYQYSKHPSVTGAWNRMLGRVAKGELPHSDVVLEAVIGVLAQRNGAVLART